MENLLTDFFQEQKDNNSKINIDEGNLDNKAYLNLVDFVLNKLNKSLDYNYIL